MTHRMRDDAAPLGMALVGLLFLAGSAIVAFTPTHVPTERPTGPRLEVTATIPVPRPVVGENCFPADMQGLAATGPVVCQEQGVGQWRWVAS